MARVIDRSIANELDGLSPSYDRAWSGGTGCRERWRARTIISPFVKAGQVVGGPASPDGASRPSRCPRGLREIARTADRGRVAKRSDLAQPLDAARAGEATATAASTAGPQASRMRLVPVLLLWTSGAFTSFLLRYP